MLGPVRLESRTIQLYLGQRGLAEGPELADYLTPRLSRLSSPVAMKDRDVAAKRICASIRAGDEIAVFGDYDCDGMTATAVLADALEGLGAKVTTWLASRFDGGYGFSERALSRILERRPGLLITCDCGSSDHATLEKLAKSGIDAIVVDHHLVPDKPLPVVAFLNPHRPDCEFSFKHMASCGLVFLLAAAVREKLGREFDLRPLLELVAIGSIGDVVPLVGDNRIMVRAGLARMMNPQRPGLIALLDLLGFERNQPVTGQDIAFRLAPRLNAPGRLGAPDLALALLREKNLTRARELAAEIEEQCQRRRTIQDDILSQAEEQIEKHGYADHSAIVVGEPGWNHGIVGIVAGRLADKHQKPVIVVGFEGEQGTGSVRGIAGFPLYDAVGACKQHLIRYGGHQAACGVTVTLSQLDAFRTSFVQACSEIPRQDVATSVDCIELQAGDGFSQVLEDLYLLEPCGQDNPAPRLRLSGRVVTAREVRGGHLRLELDVDQAGTIVGFGPSLGNWASLLGDIATIEGQLRPDRFRGGGAVELLISSVGRG